MNQNGTQDNGGKVEGVGAAYLRAALSENVARLAEIEAERRDALAGVLIRHHVNADADKALRYVARELRAAGFDVSDEYSHELLRRIVSAQSN